MRIALLMPHSEPSAHDYFRPYLTPNQKDEWRGCEFVVNPEEGSFDGIVVEQSVRALDRKHALFAPPTRTLLVLKEPPDILYLPDAYMRQFASVLAQDPTIRHPRLTLSQSGHNWFVEVPIDQFQDVGKVPKTRLISAVVSSKTDTIGHVQRLRFMKALKLHFGDSLDWFGRGIKDIGKHKLSGLSDYKYHIVIENGRWPHYWTEKLADAFVANCFPFYWGAPNITEYFNSESFFPIDICEPERAIAEIEKCISEDRFGASQPALSESRQRVASTYHRYSTYLALLQAQSDSAHSRVVIAPHNHFRYSLFQRLESSRISGNWRNRRLGMLAQSS